KGVVTAVNWRSVIDRAQVVLTNGGLADHGNAGSATLPMSVVESPPNQRMLARRVPGGHDCGLIVATQQQVEDAIGSTIGNSEIGFVGLVSDQVGACRLVDDGGRYTQMA